MLVVLLALTGVTGSSLVKLEILAVEWEVWSLGEPGRSIVHAVIYDYR